MFWLCHVAHLLSISSSCISLLCSFRLLLVYVAYAVCCCFPGVILHYTILYYTILYYTMLYYDILYYDTLYYTILYKQSLAVPDSSARAGATSTRPAYSVPCFIYVCIYIYMYIYIYTHNGSNKCVYMCIHIYIYIGIISSIIYIYIYICIHTHTYMTTRNIARTPRGQTLPRFLQMCFSPLGVVVRFRTVVAERITPRPYGRQLPKLFLFLGQNKTYSIV